jgi:hypothetical protein
VITLTVLYSWRRPAGRASGNAGVRRGEGTARDRSVCAGHVAVPLVPFAGNRRVRKGPFNRGKADFAGPAKRATPYSD